MVGTQTWETVKHWGGGKRTQGVPLAFTQLLHENTSHLLRQDPAGVDEAREITPCAELHDEVDIVTVPLEVFQLHNVGVPNALEDFNLSQEVFHRCLVETFLGHAFYSYHLPSILL